MSNKLRYQRDKKYYLIRQWKKNGLISNDFDILYENYKQSKKCEKCNIEFGVYGDGSSSFKCLDHDHVTGMFRKFLCHRCNMFEDRQTNKNNTSGYPNITYKKDSDAWAIRIKRFKKSIVHKTFKSKYDAIIYRWLLKELHNI